MIPFKQENFFQNWKSALTVALISVPLSLALAIASGATPLQGIITAIWAGLIGSILGGSPYNIIGPTGAISGVLVAYAITHGSAVLPVIAVLSGIFIFLGYFFRLDRYIIFIPKSVVHGFTLGVAFVIGLGQINNILGITGLEKKDSVIENLFQTLSHISEIQWSIFLIFIVSTALVFIWDKKFPKFPGAIILAILGIIIMLLAKEMHLDFHLLTLGDQYSNIHASLFESTFWNLDYNILFEKSTWIISGAVAVIGILETLLSGQIAAYMTKTSFFRSREVLALSIANIASGLMGGIPATAALARTSLNIKSGATGRTSAFLSSLFIIGIVLFLFYFFKFLPMVVIASILVVISIRMVEVKGLIHFINDEKLSFYISLLVAIIVILEDPIMGIIIGTFITLLVFVNKISYGQTEILLWKNRKMIESIMKTEIIKRDTIESDLVIYKISGTLTYINMPAHIEAINKIKHNDYVILSLRHAFYADLDGIEYLEEIINTLKQNNKKVYLSGVNKEIIGNLQKENFFKRKKEKKMIYNRTSEIINELYGS